MKAIAFAEYGGPEVLEEVELPRPEPGPSDVVVEVGAVCVGRLLDVAARAGKLPFLQLPLPHVLGAEHAGVVAAVGDAVTDLQPGTAVAVFPVITCGACAYCRRGREEACPQLEIIGVHRQGAYAQYTCVPRDNVFPLPEGLNAVEGAALALAGPLAWRQFEVAGVEPGQWLLVQAGGSALGSLTAALGVHRGARVIATSRQAEKREALETLGVEAALDWTDDDFVDRVRQLTDGRGVPVAIDNIGAADMFAKTLASLDRAGTLIFSGAFIGGKPAIDLRSLYTLSQRIVGMRTTNLCSASEFWEQVGAELRPVIDRPFDLTDAPAAHAHVQDDHNFGRVALTP